MEEKTLSKVNVFFSILFLGAATFMCVVHDAWGFALVVAFALFFQLVYIRLSLHRIHWRLQGLNLKFLDLRMDIITDNVERKRYKHNGVGARWTNDRTKEMAIGEEITDATPVGLTIVRMPANEAERRAAEAAREEEIRKHPYDCTIEVEVCPQLRIN